MLSHKILSEICVEGEPLIVIKWVVCAVCAVCVTGLAHTSLHRPMHSFDWAQQVDMCEGTLDEGERGHVTLQESAARRLTNQPCITEYKQEHLRRRTWGHMGRGGSEIPSHADLLADMQNRRADSSSAMMLSSASFIYDVTFQKVWNLNPFTVGTIGELTAAISPCWFSGLRHSILIWMIL